MKALVCGGRFFGNKVEERRFLYSFLAGLCLRRGISTIVHGACSGADKMAGLFAKGHGLQEEAFPVDTEIDGPWPAAGPRRNRRMFMTAQPQLVVAFPGGRGTRDMVKLAEAAHVETIYARPPWMGEGEHVRPLWTGVRKNTSVDVDLLLGEVIHRNLEAELLGQGRPKLDRQADGAVIPDEVFDGLPPHRRPVTLVWKWGKR